jgi:diaminopimelate decarboxylase
MSSEHEILTALRRILTTETPTLPEDKLHAFVSKFLDRSSDFVGAVDQFGSPLYLVEPETLIERARTLHEVFAGLFERLRLYYAVKSNNLPLIAARLSDAGFGLDVSSGLELELAVKCGCQDIVFSGPGKTDDELRLAADYHQCTTLLIDSFGELLRAQSIAAASGIKSMRMGVRLTTEADGLWRKFGIPPDRLGEFIDRSTSCPQLDFCGLQFHTSWNVGPERQVAFLHKLAATMAELPPAALDTIKFIDIGGGYWPPAGEWLQPTATAAGKLAGIAGMTSYDPLKHHYCAATGIEKYALALATVWQADIKTLTNCELRLEPGRWLCNDAMHLLFTVVDKKAEDLVITDAGTNAIGWERFESDYFPVINISRPALTERPCQILGSLCTPHDVWGFSYFGESIAEGDVLLIPTQGAYTYSLRQEFIKPLPLVVITGNKGISLAPDDNHAEFGR